MSTTVLIRRGERPTERYGHVGLEAKAGVVHPQARECQRLPQTPGARKRRGRAFPGGLLREQRPANTSVSDSGLQDCGTDIPGLGYSSSRKLMH